MKTFQELVEIIERLLAPDGCPWDREQTLQSMRGSLLEETCEVLEAINLDNNQLLEEELGDLFFNVVFLCKLAERDDRFALDDALKHITAKLIRRHPHIFGEAKVHSSEDVLKQWDEIKKAEKQQNAKQSVLDTIPKEFPSLMRAQKMLKKMNKAGYTLPFEEDLTAEEQIGADLLNMVIESQKTSIDAEQALRAYLDKVEKSFREWENK